MRFRTSEYITEMLINLKGAKWKRMRGLLTPAFTSGKLRTMEHLMDVCCNNMSDFLNENTKSGELIFFFCYRTYNIIKYIYIFYTLFLNLNNLSNILNYGQKKKKT